jgi:RNA polymerase Rpb3/Rpb11 dimerisation domain
VSCGWRFRDDFEVHGEERAFDVVRFSEELEISVLSEEADKLVFEMQHVDAPIVNALRRIMIAEVCVCVVV